MYFNGHGLMVATLIKLPWNVHVSDEDFFISPHTQILEKELQTMPSHTQVLGKELQIISLIFSRAWDADHYSNPDSCGNPVWRRDNKIN